MSIALTALTVFPLKSCRGIPVRQWPVDEFGLQHDRRFMVVDQSGEFMTQRDHPQLALVAPGIERDTLRLDAPGLPTLELPLRPMSSVVLRVTVWNDTCDATWMGEPAAEWLSSFLGTSCSLVHMDDATRRPVNPLYASNGSRVSFADGFPLLLISEESLADLNRRLAEPLPMNRFRPNLVVAGGSAYGEDGWKEIEIGSLGLSVVKPCERCVIPNTDQTTTERGTEPLRTLATYRNVGGKVMFGQNLLHHSSGTLRVGDRVVVQQQR
jgi:MOSC domain-containing protein